MGEAGRMSATGAATPEAAAAGLSGISTMPQTTPGARPAMAVSVDGRCCPGRSRRPAGAAVVGTDAGEDAVDLLASATSASRAAAVRPADLSGKSTMPQTTPGARPAKLLSSPTGADAAPRVPVADAVVGKPARFAGVAHTPARAAPP